MRRDPDDFGIQTLEDMGKDAPAAAARRSTVKSVSNTGGKAGDIPYGVARCFLDQCELDGLRNRELVNFDQWRAGMRYRARWLAGTPRGSYASRYTPRVQSSGGGPLLEPERRLDAQNDIEEAERGMHPEAMAALHAVAGQDEPARGRLHQLRAALDHLANFYGFAPEVSRGRP